MHFFFVKINWYKNLNGKKNFPWKSLEGKWKMRHHKSRGNITNTDKRWKFLCRQFCKTTSLHGFNFFIDNDNPVVER